MRAPRESPKADCSKKLPNWGEGLRGKAVRCWVEGWGIELIRASRLIGFGFGFRGSGLGWNVHLKVQRFEMGRFA